ncbi:hypothetical protein CISG_05261 [Coccidioides immitis RMSCC 3703]|uniref:Uncharacterized protein n=2 Tax=Coccidioides immitis TaxID=5501 RepID=A0A0J8QSQ7_COCIT|nr:hypothetical protein CIRG_00056 [Coccidioides immitis RMSCC 2394]KMU75864.1 hypothetical protein CISG_05261 [Coccidioides immitis RMSCC 3703]
MLIDLFNGTSNFYSKRLLAENPSLFQSPSPLSEIMEVIKNGEVLHLRQVGLSQLYFPIQKDNDRIRYAILASMAEALVNAFNWRLELGLRRGNSMDDSQLGENFLKEEPPPWALVGPLAEPLILTRSQTESTLHEAFARRNIQASMGYLYTV